MDGWNTSFLLGWPIFRGYVSFREAKRALFQGLVLAYSLCRDHGSAKWLYLKTSLLLEIHPFFRLHDDGRKGRFFGHHFMKLWEAFPSNCFAELRLKKTASKVSRWIPLVLPILRNRLLLEKTVTFCPTFVGVCPIFAWIFGSLRVVIWESWIQIWRLGFSSTNQTRLVMFVGWTWRDWEPFSVLGVYVRPLAVSWRSPWQS